MMRRAFLRAAASGAAATIRRRPPAQAPLRSLPPCMEGPLQRVGTSRAASSSAHHPSEQVSARGSSLVPPYLCNQRLFIYQQPSWWGPTLVAFGTLCMGVGAVVLAVEPARGIMSQESNPQKVRMWNPLRKKGACSLKIAGVSRILLWKLHHSQKGGRNLRQPRDAAATADPHPEVRGWREEILRYHWCELPMELLIGLLNIGLTWLSSQPGPKSVGKSTLAKMACSGLQVRSRF